MAKDKLTLLQKKLDTDIWIIVLITLGVFLGYMIMGNQLMEYVTDSSKPVILRLLLNAGVQFGIAGLGITVVSIYRKEKFSSFGLVKENTTKSIIGSAACFIPYMLYIFISGEYEGYHPLSILITGDVVKSGFPVNVFGMVLIALVWGFFEGFNYAVISTKLNYRYPSENKWWNAGAFWCAIFCTLFHPFSISFWGIIEIITMFTAIYGMLTVKHQTQNAWGSVFVFCFSWNAF